MKELLVNKSQGNDCFLLFKVINNRKEAYFKPKCAQMAPWSGTREKGKKRENSKAYFLFLHIHPVHSLGDAGHDFVGDGVGPFGQLVEMG